MKKIRFASFMVSLFFSMSASAGKVTITTPILPTVTTPYSSVNDIMPLIIDAALNQLIYGPDGIAETIGKYGYTPKLAEGFSNANAYAASAGTIQGYQNYSLFSVSTGVMVGIQAPSLHISDYKFSEIKKKIENDGDVYTGASAGVCLLNVGIKADFLVSDLYFNIKFGTLHVKPTSELDVRSTMFGFGVNYALVKAHNVFGDETWVRRELIGGLAKWRGLSVGAGFIYSNNRVAFKMDHVSSNDITQDFSAAGGGYTLTGSLVVNPSVNIGVEMKTYTIPLEIVTSVQLLWLLNITLGAGVDFNFGDTDISASSESPVTINNLRLNGNPISQDPTSGYKITNGTIAAKASTKNRQPDCVRPKVLTGIGVNLFPVKIDVPIVYYPKTGAAVGVTVGVVW